MRISRRQTLVSIASFCCGRHALAQQIECPETEDRFVSCAELHLTVDEEKEMAEVFAEEYDGMAPPTNSEAAALRIHPEWGRWNPKRLRHNKDIPLRIGFMSYHSSMNKIVEDAALEWQKHMDIRFEFAECDLDILVQHDAKGNSSRLGVVSKQFARRGIASLKLQDFHGFSESVKMGVTLHELGHALGLIHEHQHPESGIKFNEEEVHKYFQKNYNWSRNDTLRNVLRPYGTTGKSSVGARTNFDPSSIMMYELPKGLFDDPSDALRMNCELSDLDKNLIDNIY